MFGRSIKLFRIFGFTISMDWSWLILAALITWSLAGVFFPQVAPMLSVESYWVMGVLGALGLFFSIVFHELSHSLIARQYGMQMKGITLFIFGGVAEMTDEPPSPKAEFWMAIAGPISSLLLAAGLFIAWLVLNATTATASALGTGIGAVLFFLWTVNFILVLFNIVPAFPMDGGRVLRSALWAWKGNLRWATRVSSSFGSGFGILLMVLGVIEILMGGLMSGVWWLLIGWFIRNAARQSYQQLVMRESLEGEPVSKFMNTSPVTVDPSVTLDELVEGYVYRHGFAMFPVVQNGALLGCVHVQQVKHLPREEWPRRQVGEVMSACSLDNIVSPGTDAVQVLSQMRRTGQSRVMVVQDSRLVGVVTLKDLLKFLALKVELEDPSRGEPAIRIAGWRKDEAA